MNKKLIQYAAAHGAEAFENEEGSVTIVNTFFGANHVELAITPDFPSLRRELGY